jgi:hypothetical protein
MHFVKNINMILLTFKYLNARVKLCYDFEQEKTFGRV